MGTAYGERAAAKGLTRADARRLARGGQGSGDWELAHVELLELFAREAAHERAHLHRLFTQASHTVDCSSRE